VRVSRIASVAALASTVACAGAPKPKVFGTAPSLTPQVEIIGKDRVPMHLNITPARPSYVTAFFVVPGQGTLLLYPTDSSGSKLMPAGAQEIATTFVTRSAPDTTRLLRRPGRGQPTGVGGGDVQQGGDRSGGGMPRGGSYMPDAFVLVYASDDSLSFKALNERVIGVSLPGYADEAFNTIIKLIRAAAPGTGAWSAIAVPFDR
jgi:hypothetical protein